MASERLTGYRRADGRVGIRNHVIVLPVDDISNAAAEGIARLIDGVMALPHAYGRLQFGADLELTFQTLIGTGTNPNVAAVIVVGIEPAWTERIADAIRLSGKPVVALAIERNGDLATIASGARHAAHMLQDASALKRVEVKREEIMVSIKCGESDTTSGLGSCATTAEVVDRHVNAGGTVLFGETSELTGGEHLIAARCIDDEVRDQFNTFYNNYIAMIEATGANLLGSQPTEGNIRGGLSTIEEKALGNIAKTGTVPIVGVLAHGEAPTRSGLNFMDSSCAAAETITLFAGAGAVLHIFPTGQGNVIGNPIEPVIKLSANPITVATMSEHIDLDVSEILEGTLSLAEAGDRLGELVDATINGRLTAAEVLGHREFVLTKLYQSA